MPGGRRLRQRVNGDTVSYVVTRNINYTNICYFRCQFCAFSKGKLSENLRGRPYDLDLPEIRRRVEEAWERGATEVCLQGGIHPEYTGATYLAICHAIKEAVPGIHIHAFSPLEVWQGAKTLGRTVPDFLRELKAAGLSSLPGTAAEILDDEVRAVICPDKIKTAEWLQVMEAAHATGLRSTVTIMYGHADRYEHWARHLLRIRALQARTGGFTEFVPLPFVPMETPIFLKGRARRGPTWREAVLMHAVARLVLHPLITNIQTSWVKMGSEGAAFCLNAGRQRSRRHPDEREHHPGRRCGARPGDAAREHGGDDPRARARAAPAHDPLRRRPCRAPSRLVWRGPADRPDQHPGAALGAPSRERGSRPIDSRLPQLREKFCTAAHSIQNHSSIKALRLFDAAR